MENITEFLTPIVVIIAIIIVIALVVKLVDNLMKVLFRFVIIAFIGMLLWGFFQNIVAPFLELEQQQEQHIEIPAPDIKKVPEDLPQDSIEMDNGIVI